MENETKALVQLINTWTEENIELAFQIMKGAPELKKEVEVLYLPILNMLGKEFAFANVKNIPKDLAYNSGSGYSIPYSEVLEEIVSSMPVDSIDYSLSSLDEFPWWVCCFSGLECLNLGNNSISEIPEKITQLTNLKELNIDRNKLTKIPKSLGTLITLRKLQLDFNQIEEIPDSLGNLTNLEWLCLEANKISKLPKSLENLKSLSWLSIEKTPLGKKHKINHGMFIDVTAEQFQQFLL